MYDFDEIIPRQGTDCVKYDLREAFFGDPGVLPMWVADMDFRTPDFVVDAVKRRATHEIYGYSIRGAGWHNALISWLDRRHSWTVQKEWIVFSPGVVPALNMAVLAFTQPNDAIIVQPPVYFPFFSAVEKHGRKLVYNPMKLEHGRLNMDFDDLAEKAKQGAKLLLLCNPQNPGGSAWTKDELTTLMQICREHNILILSDEIHSDLVLRGKKHTVLAMVSPDASDLVITAIAPSKTFNLAGMGTSALVIPNEELRNRFSETIENLHLSLGTLFGNVASQAAYTHGDQWLGELLEYLRRNLDMAETYINKHIPKITMIRPEATYMVWLDCRELGLNDDELRDFMIKKARLGLNEGRTFGPGGEGFMRMNIACPIAMLKDALERLKIAIDGMKVK
ncbi:MAG: MalY/PatB family protein [Bacteroidales bacterium]